MAFVPLLIKIRSRFYLFAALYSADLNEPVWAHPSSAFTAIASSQLGSSGFSVSLI